MCCDPKSLEISETEELFMLLLFSITKNMPEPSTNDWSKTQPNVEIFDEQSSAENITPLPVETLIDTDLITEPSLIEEEKAVENDICKHNYAYAPIALSPPGPREPSANEKELIDYLKKLGFSHPEFLAVTSKLYCDQSLLKRINEYYTWGSIINSDITFTKNRNLAAIGVVTLLSAAAFVAILPIVTFAPPLLFVPLAVGVGLGSSYFFFYSILCNY